MSSQDWTNAKPPGETPIINSIYDFSAEALGQLKVWLEQAGLNIPLNQVIGYKRELRRIDRSTSTSTVSNTTTDTSVYSYTIPAGSMAIDGILRVGIKADIVHNTANESMALNIKLGGATLLDAGASFSSTTSASSFPWITQVEIANLGATDSQYVTSTSIRPLFSGGTGITIGAVRATSAVDLSVDQLLDISVDWSAASSSLSFSKRIVTVEII